MDKVQFPFGMISFDSIKVVSFTFSEPQEKVINNDFEFSVSTEFSLMDSKGIKVLQTIVSKLGNDQVLDSTFEAEFGDIDFSALFEGGKRITTNELIYRVLGGLTFSTVRGIIWSKLSGTNLSNMILPIIDPAILVLSDEENADASETNR
jgi:hypothetical protein